MRSPTSESTEEVPHGRRPVVCESLSRGVHRVEACPCSAVVVCRATGHDVLLRQEWAHRDEHSGRSSYAQQQVGHQARDPCLAFAPRAVDVGVVDIIEPVAPATTVSWRSGAFRTRRGGDDLVDDSAVDPEFLLQCAPFLNGLRRHATIDPTNGQVGALVPFFQYLSSNAKVASGLGVGDIGESEVIGIEEMVKVVEERLRRSLVVGRGQVGLEGIKGGSFGLGGWRKDG